MISYPFLAQNDDANITSRYISESLKHACMLNIYIANFPTVITFRYIHHINYKKLYKKSTVVSLTITNYFLPSVVSQFPIHINFSHNILHIFDDHILFVLFVYIEFILAVVLNIHVLIPLKSSNLIMH